MTTSNHRVVDIAGPKSPWDRARRLVVLAFFQRWWSIVLYAPQYRKGLRLYHLIEEESA